MIDEKVVDSIINIWIQELRDIYGYEIERIKYYNIIEQIRSIQILYKRYAYKILSYYKEENLLVLYKNFHAIDSPICSYHQTIDELRKALKDYAIIIMKQFPINED